VYLVVVDPGVGSSRRPIALKTPQGYAVGPDNGVLTPFLPHVTAAVVLDNPTYWRTPQPSQTFHGRDIFAPVAAHLSLGIPLDAVGTPIPPATLAQHPLPPCTQTPTGWQGQIQYIDHFGNLISTIPAEVVHPQASPQVAVGERLIPWGRCYSDVPMGELVALVGSHGYVEISCHQGNAARILDAKIGDTLSLLRQPHGLIGERVDS
ncbi:MAG: SAM-dependent chlorinase/fluorinase, partial [Gloeomargarita sp. HHBFW_bins_162]